MNCMARILSSVAAVAVLVGCSDPIGCDPSTEYEDGGYCLPLSVDSGAATEGDAGADQKKGDGATDGTKPSDSGKPGRAVDGEAASRDAAAAAQVDGATVPGSSGQEAPPESV
jgi:hypothetical protein